MQYGTGERVMAKIRKDSIGLYVIAGGWICRRSNPTIFKEGDEGATHHFDGTVIAGVGKNNTCKRGQYIEYWCTAGIIAFEYENVSEEKLRETWDWYRTTQEHIVQLFERRKGKNNG